MGGDGIASGCGNVEIGRISGKEIKRLFEERDASPRAKVPRILGAPAARAVPATKCSIKRPRFDAPSRLRLSPIVPSQPKQAA